MWIFISSFIVHMYERIWVSVFVRGFVRAFAPFFNPRERIPAVMSMCFQPFFFYLSVYLLESFATR